MDRLEVARFSSLPEAELAVSLLWRHGVNAEVADRETANSLAYAQIAMGGVRVTAPDFQIVLAREVIQRARAGEFDNDDDDGDEWRIDPVPDQIGEPDGSEFRGVLGSMKSLTRILVLVLLFGPIVVWVFLRLFGDV